MRAIDLFFAIALFFAGSFFLKVAAIDLAGTAWLASLLALVGTAAVFSAAGLIVIRERNSK